MNPAAGGSHARDARVIEQMTRWTLTMLQNAERGLIPLRVLQRTVDPSVLATLGPIAPACPGKPGAAVRVGGVRIHLVHQGLAHVASTAGRPDGRTAGYVLELRRDSLREQWRIAELTRVEDRQLVPPAARLAALRAEGDGPRRYPDDLGPLIATAERARAEAEHSLSTARRTADELKEELVGLQGKSAWKVRERTAMTAKERAARADAARWERALRRADEELQKLYEVRELREVRQLVIDGDPLMRARKPEYLDNLLGPVPQDRDERAQWRQAASVVERYRQTWEVTDREDALGPLAEGAAVDQVRQREEAADAAARYVSRRREQQPAEHEHEPTELSL